MSRVKHLKQRRQKNGVWKGETKHGIEYGSLEYVLSEICNDGLHYNFYVAEEREHTHSFRGVLEALVANPGNFSVQGVERDYSVQELRFLKKVQESIINDDCKVWFEWKG